MLTTDDGDINSWVNYQLNALGFPLVSKNENIKILYNVLLVLDKETKYSQNLSQDLQIIEKHNKELENENENLVKKKSSLLQKLDSLQLQLQESNQKFQNEKAKVGKLKEEVVSLKKSLASLRSLHNHETRGKSIQIDQLKDLINQKLNALPKTVVKENLKSKFSRKNTELDRDAREELDYLFSNYKEREGELIQENLQTKEFLFQVLCLIKQEFGIENINIVFLKHNHR